MFVGAIRRWVGVIVVSLLEMRARWAAGGNLGLVEYRQNSLCGKKRRLGRGSSRQVLDERLQLSDSRRSRGVVCFFGGNVEAFPRFGGGELHAVKLAVDAADLTEPWLAAVDEAPKRFGRGEGKMLGTYSTTKDIVAAV